MAPKRAEMRLQAWNQTADEREKQEDIDRSEPEAQRQLDLSTFDMLPKMAAEAGYVTRSNVSASSSESVLSGTTSLEPSTSQDRNRRVADLTMVWNVLDFGVSYVTAKQQSDQRWIAEERRRKVIHTIVQEVCYRKH